jgi:hypothetical protein
MLLSCTPPDGGEPATQLKSDYFALRLEFGEDSGVEFQLTYSGWARLLCDTGFVIEDIIKTRSVPSRSRAIRSSRPKGASLHDRGHLGDASGRSAPAPGRDPAERLS